MFLFYFNAYFNFSCINIYFFFSYILLDFGCMLSKNFHTQNFTQLFTLYFLILLLWFLLFLRIKIFSPSGIHFGIHFGKTLFSPETISRFSQHILWLILLFLSRDTFTPMYSRVCFCGSSLGRLYAVEGVIAQWDGRICQGKLSVPPLSARRSYG